MQLPIPDDWDGESFCRWVVCWPDSIKWKAALYGFLELPMQGRTWDFRTGNFLELREKFRAAYDYNFNLKEVIMACGDTGLQAVADAIQALANAQANASAVASNTVSGCNCLPPNGGVQGSVPSGDGVMPWVGNHPPKSIAPGEFPDGYASLEEYLADKCAIANLIYDGVRSTLAFLAGLTLANLAGLGGVLALGVAGILILPEIALPTIIAALAIGSVVLGALAAFNAELPGHKDDFICAIYDADTAQQAINALSDLIDEIVALLDFAGPIGVAVKTVLIVLISPDTLNQAFSFVAGVTHPDADCSVCVTCSDCTEPANFVLGDGTQTGTPAADTETDDFTAFLTGDPQGYGEFKVFHMATVAAEDSGTFSLELPSGTCIDETGFLVPWYSHDSAGQSLDVTLRIVYEDESVYELTNNAFIGTVVNDMTKGAKIVRLEAEYSNASTTIVNVLIGMNLVTCLPA